MFVYCIISDHTDSTVIQRATNNVDACTHCAYLFFGYIVMLRARMLRSLIIKTGIKERNIRARHITI